MAAYRGVALAPIAFAVAVLALDLTVGVRAFRHARVLVSGLEPRPLVGLLAVAAVAVALADLASKAAPRARANARLVPPAPGDLEVRLLFFAFLAGVPIAGAAAAYATFA